jgi:hypothetical protein
MSSGVSSRIIFTVLFVSSVFWSHVSARRSRRYPSYEHNEVDVLQGIDSGDYDQIYIQYHGCVWSEFGDGYGCADEGNANEDDDATWYLGRTQCYRANVAYALYGIRSEDKRKKHPNNICKKRRYFINSYFTHYGMEDFGWTVGLTNGGDASSDCTIEDVDNGDNENNAEGDDNVNQQRQHGEIINANTNSYTTYCTKQGKFVTAQFGGSYCSDKRNLQSVDSLDDLNSELENVGCLLVYTKNQENAAEYQGDEAADHEDEADNHNDEAADQEEEANHEDDEQAANDQNGEDRRLVTRGLEDPEGENNADGALWELLAYSNVCSLVEYRHICPDPFGAKRKFDLDASRSNGFWKQFMWLDWLTLVCFLFSIVLLVMAFCVYRDRRRRVRASINKSQRKGSLWSNSNSNIAGSRERSGTNNSGNKEASTFPPIDSDGMGNSQKARRTGFLRGWFTRKNNCRS